jgi:YD repeat-containing protein
METIARQIKWDFKTNGDLIIRDKNDNLIYFEDSHGTWRKYEMDSQGNLIYYENSDGFWVKCEYDSQGKLIYWENSKGDWRKWEYDSKGNIIYHEDSDGAIVDYRPKSCENKEIVIGGEKFKLVKV